MLKKHGDFKTIQNVDERAIEVGRTWCGSTASWHQSSPALGTGTGGVSLTGVVSTLVKCFHSISACKKKPEQYSRNIPFSDLSRVGISRADVFDSGAIQPVLSSVIVMN